MVIILWNCILVNSFKNKKKIRQNYLVSNPQLDLHLKIAEWALLHDGQMKLISSNSRSYLFGVMGVGLREATGFLNSENHLSHYLYLPCVHNILTVLASGNVKLVQTVPPSLIYMIKVSAHSLEVSHIPGKERGRTLIKFVSWCPETWLFIFLFWISVRP